jgi:hypothetical protein
LWLAVATIVLLITVQLISSYDGPATLLANAKRLKYATVTVVLFFLVTVAIRIYEVIISM